MKTRSEVSHELTGRRVPASILAKLKEAKEYVEGGKVSTPIKLLSEIIGWAEGQ